MDTQNPISGPDQNTQPVIETETKTSGISRFRSRKFKLILASFVLIILISATGVGVYLVQQSQEPERALQCSDWCTSPQDCTAATGRATTPCSFTACSPGLVACTLEPEPSDGGQPGQCVVQFPGGVTGSIEISSGCTTVPFDVYYRQSPNGTTDGDCVGTNENSLGVRNLGPGTYNPRDFGPGGCGYCVQMDGGGGGSAQFTGNCAIPTATATSQPTTPPTIPPTTPPTAIPTATATPTAPPATRTPTIAPTLTPTPTPTAIATAIATSTGTPTPTATLPLTTATPTPTVTPSTAPGEPTATATATASIQATDSPSVVTQEEAVPTNTPPHLPDSGVAFPTFIGVIMGILLLGAALFLLS